MTEIKFEAFSSLSGLIMEGELLLNNCHIREITSEDEIVKELVKWNLSNIHYLYAEDFDNYLILKHLGVNYLVTYKCREIIDDIDKEKITVIPDLNDCNEILYLLITCFRLYKKGLIGTNYVNYRAINNTSYKNITQLGRRIYLDTKRYNPLINQLGGYFLSEFEKEEFKKFYTKYYNKIENSIKSIKRSIEWFNKSYNEINLDAILLSLIISLETLYREKSLRLILRCTYNIGKNENDREKIYDNLDKAYKLRNRIVHGSYINQEELKEIIILIYKYLRISILKYLESNNTNKLIKTIDKKIKRGI